MSYLVMVLQISTHPFRNLRFFSLFPTIPFVWILLFVELTMVEGPGATRNGNKARMLVGWTAVLVIPEGKLQVPAVLREVSSVGKEVFLIFDDMNSLRLHFGMNGSLIIRNKSIKENSWKPAHQNEPPSMIIRFNRNDNVGEEKLLECRSTTVNQVTALVAQSKIKRLTSRDVCSPSFDVKTVVDALLQRPDAMIADALLDQARFPGVGNIIKIEGLHRSNLNPLDSVSSLSKEDLARVVLACRDYAMQWYKQGRSPVKFVYNQASCQTCSSQVKIQKVGGDLSRTTFWCVMCQPMKIEAGHVPKKSLDTHTVVPKCSEPEPPKMECPQHGPKRCKLRRVRKSTTTNQDRIFLCCQVHNCPYFQWADTHFRQCCGVPVLRISKTVKTGGKWFLSCHRCQFFEWAKPKDLAPIACRLTPLL
jgi:formamidopyrimidine-DNA glycosylase